MSDAKKNIYQKLLEIRKKVEYVQKNGQGFGFNYATESQILCAIRPEMDRQGIFLEQETVSLESVMTRSKNKQGEWLNIPGLKATYKFTWIDADNPEERIEKIMILQDEGDSIDTVGSLLTYSNRYFLYKFFSVPTDKMDPDSFENMQKKEEKKEKNENSAIIKKTYISIENASEIDYEISQNIDPLDSSWRLKMLTHYGVKNICEIESCFEKKIKAYVKSTSEKLKKKEVESA